jgi:hypothetical protein
MQPIRSFKKTVTFPAAGVLKFVFDRSLPATLGDYQTYLSEDVNTYFTDLIIDPVDSGINGAYCIEVDQNDAITVDNTTFDDSVKRFTANDVILDTQKQIKRLQIYADKAGSLDIVLEYNA